MRENRYARCATLNATPRCQRNTGDSIQEKPYRYFPSKYSKECNQCAEKKASEPMKCKCCRQTKPRLEFCHGLNKCQAVEHCAACKGLKQCAVERRKAWCDPEAERWTAKQNILVCGACKSERGCTDKESE